MKDVSQRKLTTNLNIGGSWTKKANMKSSLKNLFSVFFFLNMNLANLSAVPWTWHSEPEQEGHGKVQLGVCVIIKCFINHIIYSGVQQLQYFLSQCIGEFIVSMIRSSAKMHLFFEAWSDFVMFSLCFILKGETAYIKIPTAKHLCVKVLYVLVVSDGSQYSRLPDGMFRKPSEGQSLISYLSEQDFGSCADLEKVRA